MTSKKELEAELEAIDSEIDDLSANSSGFKLSTEIHRLRAAVFSRDSKPARKSAKQFRSEHERIERIKSLQRERERVVEALSRYENSASTEDTATPLERDP